MALRTPGGARQKEKGRNDKPPPSIAIPVLSGTDDQGKRPEAHDFLFTFRSNHGSIWLGFRDTDNVNVSVSMTFWPLLVVA